MKIKLEMISPRKIYFTTNLYKKIFNNNIIIFTYNKKPQISISNNFIFSLQIDKNKQIFQTSVDVSKLKKFIKNHIEYYQYENNIDSYIVILRFDKNFSLVEVIYKY